MSFEGTVQIERRRTGAFLLYLALGLGIIGFGAIGFRISKVVAAVLLGGGMFLVRTGTRLAGKGLVPARLRIETDAITLLDPESENEIARVPRGEITSGGFLPARRGGNVILLGQRGEERLSLRVTEAEEGTRILEELGLDATAHRSTFEGVYPMTKRARLALSFGGLAAGAAAFGAGLGPLPFLVVLVGVAAFFAWPTEIEIASDGVRVKTLFGARYVRYRDVVAIEEELGVIAAWLVLRDGRRVAVPSVSKAGARGDAALERNTLMLERMHNAWVAQRGGSGAEATAAIARGGRGVGDWVEALRTLRSGSDYRAAAIPPEKLVEVVEDVAAPDDARVAAAYLLAGGDETLRQRVRVAAEATGSPKLRVALSTASDDDAEAAERALAEVAEDEASATLTSARRSP